MEIISQTLVVIDRPAPGNDAREILVGVQKRGEWDTLMNFPGGKSKGSELPADAAARELREETGVAVPANQLRHLGNLIITDHRPMKRRFGTVAIYGAHLDSDPPLEPKADEFDCFWVNPTDRNVLINMPRDVGYWLPLVYRRPFVPFVCVRTVDETGGDWFEIARLLPGQHIDPVNRFSTNL